MFRTAIVVAFLLGGCGNQVSHPAEPPPPSTSSPPSTDAPARGGEGTVCRVGDRPRPGPPVEAHPCNEGLSCCYPCGIAGCDSVCMTDCGPPRP